MKIRIVNGRAGYDRRGRMLVWNPGRVVEVDDAEGKRLIEVGDAEPVEEEKGGEKAANGEKAAK